jgi:hypothetical protein
MSVTEMGLPAAINVLIQISSLCPHSHLNQRPFRPSVPNVARVLTPKVVHLQQRPQRVVQMQ